MKKMKLKKARKCNGCGKMHTEVPEDHRIQYLDDNQEVILGYFWECHCIGTTIFTRKQNVIHSEE